MRRGFPTFGLYSQVFYLTCAEQEQLIATSNPTTVLTVEQYPGELHIAVIVPLLVFKSYEQKDRLIIQAAS
jgi:hypothetical protein